MKIQSEAVQVAQESTFVDPDSHAPLPDTQLEADLRASLRLVQQRKENRQVPVAMCDPSIRNGAHAEPTENANGMTASEEKGHTAPRGKERTHANGAELARVYEDVDQETNTAPSTTTKLEHALRTAISAASNAEKFGAELGYMVRFDADAIKSMAITVLINMSQGVRR